MLLSDVDKLAYRELQIELKARNLKAAGKTDILRERLRQSILDNNEDESLFDDLDECSICLDKLSFDLRITIQTACLHRYHRICLKQWIQYNSQCALHCPLCRCSLANDKFIQRDVEKKLNA